MSQIEEIRQPSSHVDRDKDPLEQILEPWGVWRGWGVAGLSSPRTSPIVSINKLRREKTDFYDLQRYAEIRNSLIKIGYSEDTKDSKRLLREQTNKEWREWRIKINCMSIPRETRDRQPTIPDYCGDSYFSKIDRILSGIYGPYYKILIRKYEDQWSYKDFAKEYGISKNLASQRIFKARRAARKILAKNGYRT